MPTADTEVNVLLVSQVVLVTTQLIIFGNYRFNHTKYYHDNHIAFEHLFLKDWDAVREINAYPPATGNLKFQIDFGKTILTTSLIYCLRPVCHLQDADVLRLFRLHCQHVP